ncbi:hypothetical protein ACIREE_39545 [Streptomyces sp. NPDC102467]|uniref:hypothetical protein n=1 Tax=Streptomyces sp. NPDC102467 TaxID=3366179 RepID=UPI0037F93BDE
MPGDYPAFRLRLPNDGPTASGRLLKEKGTNGSQKFVVSAGSPVRPEVVPSFAVRVPSSHRLREQKNAEGVVRGSAAA